MISIDLKWVNGPDSGTFPTREVSAEQAIEHLVMVHLVWFGRVTRTTPTSIMAVTQVLAVTDTCTYTGPVDEMKKLVRFVHRIQEGISLPLAVMSTFDIRDEEDLRAGLSARLEDLLAAAELAKECGVSLREVLAL